MIFRKAFKFRLNTTPEIEQKLFKFSGCCRFVWNKALSVNLYRLENNLPIIWYNEGKNQRNMALIAKLHEKIAYTRHDHLHKISTEISENQALIVVEPTFRT